MHTRHKKYSSRKGGSGDEWPPFRSFEEAPDRRFSSVRTPPFCRLITEPIFISEVSNHRERNFKCLKTASPLKMQEIPVFNA